MHPTPPAPAANSQLSQRCFLYNPPLVIMAQLRNKRAMEQYKYMCHCVLPSEEAACTVESM